MKTIRIGTRKSQLAMVQAHIVADNLKFLGYNTEIIGIETSGDKLYNQNLALVGGKGLFLKEIEEKLLANEIDIAVHSMKDVPAHLPDGLCIPIILPREDVRDCLLSLKYNSLSDLPKGAKVGTSSNRRKFEILSKRPDLEIVFFRGNITTRISKLEAGEVDACILSYAGLKRLNLTAHAKEVFSIETILPAIAQGALGIEMHSNNPELKTALLPLNCELSNKSIACEREFMAVLGGNCKVPLAAHATIRNNTVHFRGKYYDDQHTVYEETSTGSLSNHLNIGKEAGLKIQKARNPKN